MVLAVAHTLLAILYVDLFKRITKTNLLTKWHFFATAIAGLLPDSDIIIRFIIKNILKMPLPNLLDHRGIFHTPFFALIFFIPGIILFFTKKRNIAIYLLIATFGIMLHISLDYITSGGIHDGIMWLYPISTHAYQGIIGFVYDVDLLTISLDAFLLITWFFYILKTKRLKEFF
ncbi:MAG TPA: metal-dependent hydrolase [Candidatus Nanoarchaeia archaeon]|nr:metal-dependent hydrolase [Candidatus Nanoarchaeia archaeon]